MLTCRARTVKRKEAGGVSLLAARVSQQLRATYCRGDSGPLERLTACNAADDPTELS